MGKAKRKDRRLFYVEETTSGNSVTQDFEAIGKDNDELSRELNNEVEAKENVLGETTVEITKAPQVTTVDPCYYRSESKLAQKLKSIEWEDKDGDEVIEKFMEVDLTDEPVSGAYPAFIQNAAIDVKSAGGDTKGLAYPFDLNWVGPKTYGTFNPTSKEFTPTASAGVGE